MSIGIYKIVNPSGKIYIGQSWCIENRLRMYKALGCKNQRKLYNSLLKYGFDNHQFEVIREIEEVNCNQFILDWFENYWINYYKLCGKEMLNIKGAGSAGKHSEETKIRMSQSRMGHIGYWKGKTRSEETRKKMSEAQSKDKHPMWGKEGYWKGKTRSEETRKKMSEAQSNDKNFWYGKVGPRKDIKHSEETKMKISESKKGQKPPNLVPIEQYDLNDNLIKKFNSIAEAARELNLQTSLIGLVVNGRRKQTGGFKFKKK